MYPYKNTDSLKNKTNECLYDLVTEFFPQAINSKFCVVLEDTVHSAFALFGTVFIGRSKIDKTTAFIVPKNVLMSCSLNCCLQGSFEKYAYFFVQKNNLLQFPADLNTFEHTCQ